MEAPFFSRSHMEKMRDNGYKFPWRDSDSIQEGNFSHQRQSALGLALRKVGRFPNIGLFEDSAGQGIGPSCLDRVLPRMVGPDDP